MENYKQKYEQALERAKGMYEQGMMPERIEYIFPELKESEDERIRKELIMFLEYCQDTRLVANQKREKWIEWLEKQGGKKPSDKVEPKFKVGDWVVDICSPHNPYKIIEVCESWYEIIDTDDSHYSISFNLGAKDFRLWTIRDAKDGDILQANKCTLIFDSLAKDIDGNTVISSWYHCNTKTFYGMGTCKPDLWVIDGVIPATKEQRDFLFAKMKESGYKWDSNKKELIKQ